MIQDSEQLQAFHDLFDSFDTDKSGTIDIDELNIGLSKQSGSDLSEATTAYALELLLNTFDTNKDGVLQLDEFINLMTSTELEEFLAQEDASLTNKRGLARQRSVAMNQDIDLEEIYGVTPTPEETPSFVQEKILEFDRMLDDVELEHKTAFTMAQEKCPSLCGENFKLAFLRCEVFNVKPAVDRWIKYWDKRLLVFGKDKAFLPMTLEGAMKGDEKLANCGYLSVAEGTTDPDGRAIALFDYRIEAGDISSEDLIKHLWYQTHIGLASDLAQKKGVVVFVKCLDKLSQGRISLWKKSNDVFKGALPVRTSAMHFVCPPAWMKMGLKIVKVVVGEKLRKRLYMHNGSTESVLKSLSPYGLGTKDKLPELFGGNLVFSAGVQ